MSQTIQNELNDLLNKFARNSVSQPQAADPFAPVLDPTGNPIEPVAPAVEPPKVEPAPTPVATTITQPVEPAQPASTLIDDWDKDVQIAEPTTPVVPDVTPAPAFDFTEVAKVLGKEDVKAKEEVLAAVAELKQKAELLAQTPEDLVKAMEIAKAGGNYLEYLQVSVVDWSKEDPAVLYENYVEDQFYNPDTQLVDYEKVDKILETMTEEEKEFRGRELQKQYITYQKQQKDFIAQQAQAKRAQFEQSVRQVVNELKDINEFVVTPAKKQELLEYVLSGQDLQENDVRSRVVNAFIKKNFHTIDKFMKTKIRNASQREILSEAQIPDIKTSSTPPPAAPSKQYSVQDYIAELAQKRGF
jgi:hypothetical protein